ncbi:hypothetical protein HCJ52_14265 [Listeria sp. FSL L7-1485]|uniref:Uncharacterized protein n=1 Tax=Listeria immobilis TaxID=2713502 RepID=A0A7X0X8F0_9LIST|nr:hypothetical protein [Listeria immobilis]MBC1489131.1 hypothetical protein [Listeria immobilis]MBC1515707.1 hypothetical protein [Listeria immobilis]MBC1537263.1 hypothetical protein [Listeria immobilis]
MNKSVMAEDTIKYFKCHIANREDFYNVKLFDEMTLKEVLDSILRVKGHPQVQEESTKHTLLVVLIKGYPKTNKNKPLNSLGNEWLILC